MESQSDLVGETAAWLRSFLTRPHAELGRKGAVCPFMEQSLKLGRAALSSVDVSGPRGQRRLETTARSALARLGEDAAGDNVYNAFVMVPVGTDESTRAAIVLDVQQELKAEAIAAGKMVGEFFPGHPMPGIHNPSFRPLAAPHPLLAVRTMVITDILFLVFPSIPPADRLAYLDVWHPGSATRRSPPGRSCTRPPARRPSRSWGPGRRRAPAARPTRTPGARRGRTSVPVPDPLDHERRRLAGLFDIAPSRVLYALCTLRVADRVPRDGIGAGDLAEVLGLHRDRLTRLIRAAETLDVLHVDAGDTVPASPRPAPCCARTPPGSLRAEFSDNSLFTAWGPFAETVSGGRPSYELAHGTAIFDSLGDDREALRTFHEHMRMRAHQLYRPPPPGTVAALRPPRARPGRRHRRAQRAAAGRRRQDPGHPDRPAGRGRPRPEGAVPPPPRPVPRRARRHADLRPRGPRHLRARQHPARLARRRGGRDPHRLRRGGAPHLRGRHRRAAGARPRRRRTRPAPHGRHVDDGDDRRPGTHPRRVDRAGRGRRSRPAHRRARRGTVRRGPRPEG
ncbi:hypothetical protein LT493_25845 [Streptomyces tricolor]|nr:hypothetical protein [Streptomyces tricolor]